MKRKPRERPKDARGVSLIPDRPHTTKFPTEQQARARLESWRDKPWGEDLADDHSFEHLFAAMTVLLVGERDDDSGGNRG